MENLREEEIEIITLRDEEGNEAELELLDTIEYDGNQYVVLFPMDAEDDDPVVIMMEEEDNYFFIDDQEVIDGVFAIFMQRQEME